VAGNNSEVAAADAYCRSLVTRHYENFAVASWFLSSRVRRDLQRVYAFCRTTDDLGDESGADALQRLARWRREVEEFFGGTPVLHPVLVALRDTVARVGLGAQPFLDLIAANEQDQRIATYATWTDLRAYCMLSAAPVGRIVLRVFGLTDPALEPLSDDVCIGLQLANFAQDVARDARIGRTYLLGEDVTALGIAGATQAMCERARALLGSGETLERAAPPALRLQLSLYRLGGLAICDAIGRDGYRTDLRRPVVSKRVKARLLARGLLAGAADIRGGHRAQHA
jgi:squalene synthase HpnC